jgi:hypothetical protein
MNQIGIFTGVTVGASVLLLYEVLRRRAAAPSVKRGRHLDSGGDSTAGDSGGSSLGSGHSDCASSGTGSSCDGAGGDGGGD